MFRKLVKYNIVIKQSVVSKIEYKSVSTILHFSDKSDSRQLIKYATTKNGKKKLCARIVVHAFV